jgi:hypothetical protein
MTFYHSRDYSLILIRLKSFIKGSAIKPNKILSISISYSSTFIPATCGKKIQILSLQ